MVNIKFLKNLTHLYQSLGLKTIQIKQLKELENKTGITIVATTLAIKYLTTMFEQYKSEWELLVDKATRWFKDNMTGDTNDRLSQNIINIHCHIYFVIVLFRKLDWYFLLDMCR